MWSKQELEAALDLELEGNNQYGSVVIDSRKVKENDIFIGIKGRNYNGSDFAKNATDSGASLCLVASSAISHPNIVHLDDPYLDGLMPLAKYSRDKKHKDATFIGITGSIGKTTTKEMLSVVLKSISDQTYCNYGNQNNHYGLPLSLANIDKEHLKYGIFELGMSAPGEILFLASIAKPHIAFITGIAPAHMESFESLEGIAAAKSEIISGIEKDGFLVLNFDSPCIDTILSISKFRPDVKICGYSTKQIDEDIFYKVILKSSEIMTSGSPSTKILLHINCNGEELNCDYSIGCIGDDYVTNSMAIASCLMALSSLEGKTVDLSHLSELENFNGVPGRGAITHLKDIILIDEAYNANPTSMVSAIKKLEQNSKIFGAKRSVAILGDMLELGRSEIEMHKDLASELIRSKISFVICVGERMKHLHERLGKTSRWFKSNIEVIAELPNLLQPCDIVLVKASNSMKLSEVCTAISSQYSPSFSTSSSTPRA